METTRAKDPEISEALTEFGIKHEITEYGFTVDRTSMCHAFPKSGDEHASYTETLILIRIVCGDQYYVSWSGRTDEFLGFEVYVR